MQRKKASETALQCRRRLSRSCTVQLPKPRIFHEVFTSLCTLAISIVRNLGDVEVEQQNSVPGLLSTREDAANRVPSSSRFLEERWNGRSEIAVDVENPSQHWHGQ